MKTETLVLVVLVGLLTAGALELILSATTFGEQLESFDTIFAVASMGLIWLFKNPGKN